MLCFNVSETQLLHLKNRIKFLRPYLPHIKWLPQIIYLPLCKITNNRKIQHIPLLKLDVRRLPTWISEFCIAVILKHLLNDYYGPGITTILKMMAFNIPIEKVCFNKMILISFYFVYLWETSIAKALSLLNCKSKVICFSFRSYKGYYVLSIWDESIKYLAF